MSMHLHRATHLAISIVGGFISSFGTLTLLPYLRPGVYSGQLIAGNPNTTKHLPTTLNMMHGAMDGTNAIALGITTFTWWIFVSIGTLICSSILFRMMRRYV